MKNNKTYIGKLMDFVQGNSVKLRSLSGNTVHKPALRRYQGFIYDINVNTTLQDKDALDEVVDYLRDKMVMSYLKKMSNFEVSDDFWDVSDYTREEVEKMSHYIYETLGYIKDNSDDNEIEWRLNGNKHSTMFIMINRFTIDGDGLGILMMDYDGITSVCQLKLIGFFMKDGGLAVAQSKAMPMYVSSKDRYVEKVIDHNYPYKDITHKDLVLIYESLKKFKDDFISQGIPNSPNHVRKSSHTPFELKCISSVARAATDQSLSFKLAEWNHYDDPGDNTTNIINNHPATTKLRVDGSDYPLVDFTPKEMKFVHEYMCKLDILTSDRQFDLKPYLINPRYGNTLKFKRDTGSDGVIEVTVSYKLVEEHNACRFFVIHKINKDLVVFSMSDYSNVDRFVSVHDVKITGVYLVYTNTDRLFPNIEEINKVIPTSLFMEPASIYEAIHEFIMTQIIIHDRPQRSKVVKCTRKKTYMPGEAHKHKNDDEDYVISRILKPAKEAKKYVAAMAKKHGTYGAPEYTIESWDRAGHWRTTNTGKTIWIKGTTCKRRLPISDKEIHIKL